MLNYEFGIVGLEAGPQGSANLHLRGVGSANDLRVRVGALDAQTLAAELAGLQTARSRLVSTMGRLAHSLNARISHVQLERRNGNVIEAHLGLVTDVDQMCVPLSFSDAIALVHALHVPIYGDASLTPLLQTADEPVFHVPATIEAFVNSLSDA